MNDKAFIKIKKIRKKFFKKKSPKTKFLNIYKKSLIITILIISCCYLFYTDSKYIIEVDIGPSKYDGGGPVQLSKGIAKVLPYKTNNCLFIPSESISLENSKKNSHYFFISFPGINEQIFEQWKKINKTNALLLGPNYVPIFWRAFPIESKWKEKNFREILKNIKGYVVHSERVRNHLSTRSKTTDMLNKYIISRACTYIMPKKIKSFEERQIDILFYEKFADSNRGNQSYELKCLFNSSGKKLVNLKYGSYNKKQICEISNNSKFVIYFSFYDTGAIGLKEIQNFGVFSFTVQEDLAIHKKTSLFIPELENIDDMKPAFKKITQEMNIISESHPDTQLMAKINQDINKCEKALDDICKRISSS